MTKIFLLILLFQLQLAATAQRVKYMAVSKQVRMELLAGTYHAEGMRCTFKKNMRCKVVFTGPRSLVFKGRWNIHQDTIVCRYHQVNFVLQGKNKELAAHPYQQQFIVVNGMLYLREADDGVSIAFNKE